jgi:SAM-dependent methyltransferase
MPSRIQREFRNFATIQRGIFIQLWMFFHLVLVAHNPRSAIARAVDTLWPHTDHVGMANAPAYGVGHSADELERLKAQGALIAELNRYFFHEAGIRPGMRVLDVGSGAGDVALLVSQMVGPTGAVIGTDREDPALNTARARAEQAGLTNLEFRKGDPAEMTFEQPFDAVVGRLVLMYYPNPTETIKKLVEHLRPAGIIGFLEADYSNCRAYPELPLFLHVAKLIEKALRTLGADPLMGLKLPKVFLDAGLQRPQTRCVSFNGTHVDAGPMLVFAQTLKTVLSVLEKIGAATAAEIQIDTLAQRMIEEAAACNGVVVGPALTFTFATLD